MHITTHFWSHLGPEGTPYGTTLWWVPEQYMGHMGYPVPVATYVLATTAPEWTQDQSNTVILKM